MKQSLTPSDICQTSEEINQSATLEILGIRRDIRDQEVLGKDESEGQLPIDYARHLSRRSEIDSITVEKKGNLVVEKL